MSMSFKERLESWRRKLDPLIQLRFPDWEVLRAPTPGLRPMPGKSRAANSRELTGRTSVDWQNGMFDCDGRYLLWSTTPLFLTNKASFILVGRMIWWVFLVFAGIILSASSGADWDWALGAAFVGVGLFGISLFIRFCLSPGVEKVAIFDRETGLVYLPLRYRCGPMVCRFEDIKAYYFATPTLALHYSGGIDLMPEVLPPGAPRRGFLLGMQSHSVGYGTGTPDSWWSVVHRFMTSPEAEPWHAHPEWALRVEAYRRLGLTIPELYPEGLTPPFVWGCAFGYGGWPEHVEEHFARQGRALPSDWPLAYIGSEGEEVRQLNGSLMVKKAS
ncbi:hypothetical protein CAI21_00005 [Alkalilimnicola ehrlichii]|uniref:Transmembrane protein n=1 Tax=Alkalilimnicola ehrlichii TaxID=351052 RepID=A0A3E0WH55_9GAMM|nr:hypothetical protein [Alkalilimnicola ehrlichii]RFA30854.1 hypothetical protein CAL65_22645 [Alkalilimnicola ehrlichii]RFA31096.1 hypothetical protein CAI21_00005 [Alkalilimnicola ehrlichii]